MTKKIQAREYARYCDLCMPKRFDWYRGRIKPAPEAVKSDVVPKFLGNQICCCVVNVIKQMKIYI